MPKKFKLVTVDEVSKMSRDEFVNRPNPNKCYKCKTPLHAQTTGCRDTKKGLMCDDCYFKEMSDYIDKNPINTPEHIEVLDDLEKCLNVMAYATYDELFKFMEDKKIELKTGAPSEICIELSKLALKNLKKLKKLIK